MASGNGNGNKVMALRKQAIQMAGQLPEDLSDARQIICLMREIVDKFLAGKEATATIRMICNPDLKETG